MVAMNTAWGSSTEQEWRKGPWTLEEDMLLSAYVTTHGEERWSSVARGAGLNRSGKSCRLRWVNYLRPGLKRGHITPQEEGIIIELHALWGNKWSTIAKYLPGRTDNEIKNYWRTHFKKREKTTRNQGKRKAQILLQKKQQLLEQKLEESNKELSHEKKMGEAQKRKETVFFYPNGEDQCLSIMYQDVTEWSDPAAEDILLGELWNLDDPTRLISQCNRQAMQNQARSSLLSCEGDSNNFYGGEYIF